MMEEPLRNQRVDAAVAAYDAGGTNCSQAVISAYADELGADEETLRALVWGLGGGIGGMQRTCGALSAMVLVVSSRCARAGLDKPATYAKVREACRAFEERLGSMDCLDILHGEAPSHHCCPHVVRAAAECIEAGIP